MAADGALPLPPPADLQTSSPGRKLKQPATTSSRQYRDKP